MTVCNAPWSERGAVARDMGTQPIIEISGLSVGFRTRNGAIHEILKSVDLHVNPGEAVGLVGESGSGKSTVALAAMGYLRSGLQQVAGQVRFKGQDVFAMSRAALEDMRGGELALIPQNAGQALTPTMRVGPQLAEALRLHRGLEARQAQDMAAQLVEQVRLPDPDAILRRYPHEMSGGQQQRVGIAMALAGRPKALLLDEPVTGLDVTTQIHVLDLLRDLALSEGMAMLMVSHDLGVIAHCCSRVAVMRSGEKLVDEATASVLRTPRHPYARALLDATPRLTPVSAARVAAASAPRAEDTRPEMLRISDLGLSYAKPRFWRAGTPPPLTVEGIDAVLHKGATLGLVGESGSGKSTILKALAGLIAPVKGQVTLAGGAPLPPALHQRSQDQLRRIQMIFQNPDQALNPRMSAADILGQPLRLYFGKTGQAARDAAAALLDQVRLPAGYLDRLPGQLSGGEKQRLAIARAFASDPDIVLCDEITSALDVSVQATVLDLLADLKREKQTTYVFVAHDLAVVQELADQVMVLKNGRICEAGPVDAVYGAPQHPYTRALFDAVLEPDPPGDTGADPVAR
ncbi:MAG: ABC transporter ATP-binding protein [Pseudomonadota bacterium]